MQVNIDFFSKNGDFFTNAVTPSRRHAVTFKKIMFPSLQPQIKLHYILYIFNKYI